MDNVANSHDPIVDKLIKNFGIPTKWLETATLVIEAGSPVRLITTHVVTIEQLQSINKQ